VGCRSEVFVVELGKRLIVSSNKQEAITRLQIRLSDGADSPQAAVGGVNQPVE
jgi:hypothetical protein